VLKRSAASMKGGSGRKTGQLARAVGMKMVGNVLTVGTNVQKQGDVKYAKIQDEGGSTFPKVTPKSRRWAWAMYYMTKDDKYKHMALTKQSRFWVKIRPSHWFSRPMFEQLPVLNQYMDPDFIYQVAENMAGVAGGNA
jgi:hypothetical protein